MSKNKGRTAVAVDVEEFDVAVPSVSIAESPVIEEPAFKSELGFWWDCLAGLVLLQGFLNVFRSWTTIWEHSDVGLSLLVMLASVVAAIATGRYAGKESSSRKALAFVLIAAGLLFGVAAFALGGLPNSNGLTYAAVGLTITGWSLRRLLGESVVRCWSLGLVAALPLLFLDSSTVLGGLVAQIKGFVNFTGYWITGVLADINSIPFSPIDDGLKFAAGEFTSIAAFDNVAGMLVAMAISLGISVLGKQSFLTALLSAASAYLWWGIFRAGYCLNMVTTKSLNGPLSELAMPLYALLGLALLIMATNLCWSSILAIIPIDPGQFEVSPLTQIYNACVSFPQLGPVPSVPANATAKEAPLTKEDLILDEYKRAKEAALSGENPATSFSEMNSHE